VLRCLTLFLDHFVSGKRNLFLEKAKLMRHSFYKTISLAAEHSCVDLNFTLIHLFRVLRNFFLSCGRLSVFLF
jgi:hypothetical protein